VDDLETVEPWKPRGIKIHGHAEVGERQGRFGTGLYIAVLPQVAWSWGIEAPVFQDGKPDEANGAGITQADREAFRLSAFPWPRWHRGGDALGNSRRLSEIDHDVVSSSRHRVRLLHRLRRHPIPQSQMAQTMHGYCPDSLGWTGCAV
jgi:hypothetical protein